MLALVTGLYAAGLGWLHRLGAMSTPGRFLAQEAVRHGAGPGQRSSPSDLTTTWGQR